MMKSKTWIILASSLFIFFIMFSLAFTLYLVRQGVPLRFSDSISYDAKLNFIHNKKILDEADTLIVGASMALSNVSGLALEKDKRINKVANISSWGLNISDVLQQLEIIDLTKIKYIILATQFLDFDNNTLRASIEVDRVKGYLENKFDPIPYIMTMETILPDFMMYIRYKSIYMDPYTYQYLDFDASGSALYANEGFKIQNFRWENFKKKECQLDDRSFKDLKRIGTIAKEHSIRLLVMTTPIREQVMTTHPDHKKCFEEYISRLSSMAKEDLFEYLNTNSSLGLTDDYFVDKIHLNRNGAEQVSKEVLKEI